MVSITEWTKNLGKSVTYASFSYLSEKTPAIGEFTETNEQLYKAAYHAIRDYKTTLKRTKEFIQNSEYYKIGDMALNNAVDDLKTGKLYNYDRISSDSGDSFGLDDNFDDSGFDESVTNFDDMGDDETSLEPSIDAKTISSEADKSSERNANAIGNTIVSSAKYLGETNKSIANLQYATSMRMFNGINQGFNNVGGVLNSIYKFQNDVVKTHADNAKTYFETTTKLIQEQNAMLQELVEIQRERFKKEEKKEEKEKLNRFDDMSTANGAPNIAAYFKNVWKNTKNTANEMTGGALSALTPEMLKEMANNPLGEILPTIFSTLLGPKVQVALKKFNDTLAGTFSTMVSRLNRNAKDDEGGFSSILGKIFGVKDSVKTNIDTKNFEKGAMQWNGIANKTLVEVIPGYLRRIESILSGKSERIFDLESGKWSTARNIKKEFNDMHDNAPKNATSELKEEVEKILKKGVKFNSGNERKRTLEDIDRILEYIYSAGYYNPNSEEDKNRHISGVYDGSKKLFDEIFNKHIDKKIKMGLSTNILQTKDSLNKRMKEEEKKGNSKYNILFDNSSPNSHIKYYGNTDEIKEYDTIFSKLNLLEVKDKYKKTIFDWLYTINKSMFDTYSVLDNLLPQISYNIANGMGISVNHGVQNPKSEVVYGIDGTEYPAAPTTNKKTIRTRTGLDYSAFSVPSRRKAAYESELALKEEKKTTIKQDKEASELRRHNEINDKLKENLSMFEEYNGMLTPSIMAGLEYAKLTSFKENPEEQFKTFLSEYKENSAKEAKEKLKELNHGEEKDKDDKKHKNEFLKTLIDAGSIGEKWAIIRNGLDHLTDKPVDVLTGVIGSADKAIYDFFYGKDTDMYDKKGKKIKGFFNAMMFRMNKTFDTSLKYLDQKIIEPFKEKYEADSIMGAANNAFKKYTGINISEKFKGAKNALVGENGLLGPTIKSIKESYEQALLEVANDTKSVVKEVKDIVVEEMTDEESDEKKAARIKSSTGFDKIDQSVIYSHYANKGKKIIKNSNAIKNGKIAQNEKEKKEILAKLEAKSKECKDKIAQYTEEIKNYTNPMIIKSRKKNISDRTKELFELNRQKNAIKNDKSIGLSEEKALLAEFSNLDEKLEKLNEEYKTASEEDDSVYIKKRENAKKRLTNYKKIFNIGETQSVAKEYEKFKNGGYGELSKNKRAAKAFAIAAELEKRYTGESSKTKKEVLSEKIASTAKKRNELAEKGNMSLSKIIHNPDQLLEILQDLDPNITKDTPEFKELLDIISNEETTESTSTSTSAYVNPLKYKSSIDTKSKDDFGKEIHDITGLMKLSDKSSKEFKNESYINAMREANFLLGKAKQDALKRAVRMESEWTVIYNYYYRYIINVLIDFNLTVDESLNIADEIFDEYHLNKKGEGFNPRFDSFEQIKNICSDPKNILEKAKSIAGQNTKVKDAVGKYLKKYPKIFEKMNSTLKNNKSIGAIKGIKINYMDTVNDAELQKRDAANTSIDRGNHIGKETTDLEYFDTSNGEQLIETTDGKGLTTNGMIDKNGKLLTKANSNNGKFAKGIKNLKSTGLAVLSKGEAVIPSWLNPWNKDKNKSTPEKDSAGEDKILEKVGKNGIKPEYIAKHAEGETNEGGEDNNKVGWFSKTIDTVKESISTLFGLNDDKTKATIKTASDEIKQNIPDTIAKSLVGGTAGLFLGGPLVGAVLGGAVSISQHSKTVQELLYGEEITDEKTGEKKRKGGIFDKKILDKYLPSIKKYGIAGAVAGLVMPFGLLGGLALGAAAGYAKKSDEFQKSIFGEDDGLINKKSKSYLKKLFPHAAGGTAVAFLGSLAMGNPLGLLGAAIAGTGIGLVTSADQFQTAMLGPVDPITKKRKGGLVGELHDAIVIPIVDASKNIQTQFFEYMRKDIFEPIKKSLAPFGKDLELGIKVITDQIGKGLDYIFKSKLGIPFFKRLEGLSGPVGLLARGTRKGASLAGKVIASPVKLLGKVADKNREKLIKSGNADFMNADERINFMRGRGKENYDMREFDELLSNSDESSLTKINEQLTEMQESASKLNAEGQEQNKALGYGISNRISAKNRRLLIKAVRDGDMKTAEKILSEDPALRNNKKLEEELRSFIYTQGNTFRKFNKRKTLYENTRKEQMEQLKAMGLTNISFENIDKYKGNISKQISSIKQKEADKSPEEQVKDSVDKGTELINKTLTEMVGVLEEIRDGKKKISPKDQKELKEQAATNKANNRKAFKEMNKKRTSINRNLQRIGYDKQKFIKKLGYGFVDDSERYGKVLELADHNFIINDLGKVWSYGPEIFDKIVLLSQAGYNVSDYDNLIKYIKDEKYFDKLLKLARAGIDIDNLEVIDKASDENIETAIELHKAGYIDLSFLLSKEANKLEWKYLKEDSKEAKAKKNSYTKEWKINFEKGRDDTLKKTNKAFVGKKRTSAPIRAGKAVGTAIMDSVHHQQAVLSYDNFKLNKQKSTVGKLKEVYNQGMLTNGLRAYHAIGNITGINSALDKLKNKISNKRKGVNEEILHFIPDGLQPNAISNMATAEEADNTVDKILQQLEVLVSGESGLSNNYVKEVYKYYGIQLSNIRKLISGNINKNDKEEIEFISPLINKINNGIDIIKAKGIKIANFAVTGLDNLFNYGYDNFKEYLKTGSFPLLVKDLYEKAKVNAKTKAELLKLKIQSTRTYRRIARALKKEDTANQFARFIKRKTDALFGRNLMYRSGKKKLQNMISGYTNKKKVERYNKTISLYDIPEDLRPETLLAIKDFNEIEIKLESIAQQIREAIEEESTNKQKSRQLLKYYGMLLRDLRVVLTKDFEYDSKSDNYERYKTVLEKIESLINEVRKRGIVIRENYKFSDIIQDYINDKLDLLKNKIKDKYNKAKDYIKKTEPYKKSERWLTDKTNKLKQRVGYYAAITKQFVKKNLLKNLSSFFNKAKDKLGIVRESDIPKILRPESINDLRNSQNVDKLMRMVQALKRSVAHILERDISSEKRMKNILTYYTYATEDIKDIINETIEKIMNSGNSADKEALAKEQQQIEVLKKYKDDCDKIIETIKEKGIQVKEVTERNLLKEMESQHKKDIKDFIPRPWVKNDKPKEKSVKNSIKNLVKESVSSKIASIFESVKYKLLKIKLEEIPKDLRPDTLIPSINIDTILYKLSLLDREVLNIESMEEDKSRQKQFYKYYGFYTLDLKKIAERKLGELNNNKDNKKYNKIKSKIVESIKLCDKIINFIESKGVKITNNTEKDTIGDFIKSHSNSLLSKAKDFAGNLLGKAKSLFGFGSSEDSELSVVSKGEAILPAGNIAKHFAGSTGILENNEETYSSNMRLVKGSLQDKPIIKISDNVVKISDYSKKIYDEIHQMNMMTKDNTGDNNGKKRETILTEDGPITYEETESGSMEPDVSDKNTKATLANRQNRDDTQKGILAGLKAKLFGGSNDDKDKKGAKDEKDKDSKNPFDELMKIFNKVKTKATGTIKKVAKKGIHIAANIADTALSKTKWGRKFLQWTGGVKGMTANIGNAAAMDADGNEVEEPTETLEAINVHRTTMVNYLQQILEAINMGGMRNGMSLGDMFPGKEKPKPGEEPGKTKPGEEPGKTKPGEEPGKTKPGETPKTTPAEGTKPPATVINNNKPGEPAKTTPAPEGEKPKVVEPASTAKSSIVSTAIPEGEKPKVVEPGGEPAKTTPVPEGEKPKVVEPGGEVTKTVTPEVETPKTVPTPGGATPAPGTPEPEKPGFFKRVGGKIGRMFNTAERVGGVVASGALAADAGTRISAYINETEEQKQQRLQREANETMGETAMRYTRDAADAYGVVDTGKTIYNAGSSLVSKVSGATEKAAQVAENTNGIISKVKTGFDKILDAARSFLGDKAGPAIEKLKDVVTKKITTPAAVEKITKAVTKKAGEAAVAATGIGSILAIGIEAVSAAWAFTEGMENADKILQLPPGTATKNMQLLCGITSAILQAIPIVGWVLDTEDVIDLVIDSVGPIFGVNREDINKLRNAQDKGRKGFTEVVKEAASNAKDKVESAASSAWQGVKNTASGIADSVSGAASDAWGAIKTTASNAFETAKDLGGKAVDFISNNATYVYNKAGELKDSAIDFGKQTANKAADAISNEWEYATNSVKGLAGKLFPGSSGGGKYGRGAYYSQEDPRYAGIPFNISGDHEAQTVGDSGCGAFSAMNALSAKGIDPNNTGVSNAINESLKYKEKDGGTKPQFFNDYFSKYGLDAVRDDSSSDIKKDLQNGNPVVLMGQDKNGISNKTPYGTGPHYVTATGMDGRGNVITQDPQSGGKANSLYKFSDLINKSSLAISARSKYGKGKYGRGDNAETIWNWLTKDQGMSNQGAAAILGAMQQESSFNPHVIQGGEESDECPPSSYNGAEGAVGYGLCQWTGSRAKKLVEYAASKGTSSGDLMTQLEFMKQEADTGDRAGCWKRILEASSLDEAIKVWGEYEGYGVAGDRAEYAAIALEKQGKGLTNVSTGSSSSSGSKSNAPKKNYSGLFGKIEQLTDILNINNILSGNTPSSNSSGKPAGSSVDGNAPQTGSAAEFILKTLKGSTITSPYGKVRDDNLAHGGIDYGADTGTDIECPVNGEVVDVNHDENGGGYGTFVQVKDSKGNLHMFAHMSERSVEVGDKVAKGQVVGKVGNTGHSDGEHLHYEIDPPSNPGAEKGKEHIDPDSYDISGLGKFKIGGQGSKFGRGFLEQNSDGKIGIVVQNSEGNATVADQTGTEYEHDPPKEEQPAAAEEAKPEEPKKPAATPAAKPAAPSNPTDSLFGKAIGAATALSSKVKSLMGPLTSSFGSIASKIFGNSKILSVFGANPFENAFGGKSSSSGGNSGSNGSFNSTATSDSIKQASNWAQSIINHPTGGTVDPPNWYGDSGCTAFALDYLKHAGSNFEQQMTSDGLRPAWTPDLMTYAQSKGIWKDAANGGAEGDLALLETNGNRGDGPDHTVVNDGQGGFWGNSSGSYQVVHHKYSDDFGTDSIYGYVGTGSGQDTVQTGGADVDPEHSRKEAGSTSGAGKFGRGKYGRARRLFGRGDSETENPLLGKYKEIVSGVNNNLGSSQLEIHNTDDPMTAKEKAWNAGMLKDAENYMKSKQGKGKALPEIDINNRVTDEIDKNIIDPNTSVANKATPVLATTQAAMMPVQNTKEIDYSDKLDTIINLLGTIANALTGGNTSTNTKPNVTPVATNILQKLSSFGQGSAQGIGSLLNKSDPSSIINAMNYIATK